MFRGSYKNDPTNMTKKHIRPKSGLAKTFFLSKSGSTMALLVSSQLVPIFGQLVIDLGQLVPESKNRAV